MKPRRPPPQIDDTAIAQWVVETCLTFGTSVDTAYIVAGLFIKGINQRHEGE